MEVSKVQVGDKVLTTKGYEAIYAFAHDNKPIRAQFLQIYTDMVKPLEVSDDHLIYLLDQDLPVPAASIRIGDYLLGENGGMVVSRVERVEREGLYAPLTPSGNIIVDGVVASCYVSLQQHAPVIMELQGSISTGLSHHFVIHTWLTPFRLVCTWIFNSICQSFDDDSGLAHVVRAGFHAYEL